MRVQRTRGWLPAIARRSPLTRRPLGSTWQQLSQISAACAVTLSLACAHSSVPSSLLQGPAECSCVPASADLSTSAVLTAEAYDSDGQELGGTEILVSGPLWVGRTPIRWRTEKGHPLAQPLRPGSWEIKASSVGYQTFPASLNLSAGEHCTVRFRMQLEVQQMVVTY
jgi:hypothetical protein